MKSDLAAVHYNKITLGFGDRWVGDMPHPEYVVKGLKKNGLSESSQARLSITPVFLREMTAVGQKRPNQYKASMLWAICYSGFSEQVKQWPHLIQTLTQILSTFEILEVKDCLLPRWYIKQNASRMCLHYLFIPIYPFQLIPLYWNCSQCLENF